MRRKLGVSIQNFKLRNLVILKLNLPELGEECVTSFFRPRILQMEKSVNDLLETGAKDGVRTGRLGNSIRDLSACAEHTRESTRETTVFN